MNVKSDMHRGPHVFESRDWPYMAHVTIEANYRYGETPEDVHRRLFADLQREAVKYGCEDWQEEWRQKSDHAFALEERCVRLTDRTHALELKVRRLQRELKKAKGE